MTHARCCTECGKGTCCEFAGATWRNRYCLEVGPFSYYAEGCDCAACDNFGLDCDECNTAERYCCTITELDWCVRGPIFRYPPGSNGGNCVGCDTANPNTYNLCPDPWVAPDWGIGERGCSSEYRSVGGVGWPYDCNCDTAGDANHIEYRIHYKFTVHSGNRCLVAQPGGGPLVPVEEFDEVYTVRGRANIYCDLDSTTPNLCFGATTHTHVLVIEPCEQPPAGLPAGPTMIWVANLSKNVPPHQATWTLVQSGVTSLTVEDAICSTQPTNCNAGLASPCSDPPVGQFCDGCYGDSFVGAGLQVLTGYPCQDQPCTLS